MVCGKYFCMSLELRDFGVTSRQLQKIVVSLAALAEILFDFCLDCDLNKLIINMPGVPQGAFAACKVREREMKIAKMHASIEQDQEKMFYHGKYLELSPLKYNSKLMNSIWGLYNRYSVHNFKKNTDAANISAVAGSQPNGLPATVDKTSAKTNKSAPILVSEWTHFWGAHQH